MVLLHYLVVPGLADDNGSRPEVPALRADEATPAPCGGHATAAAEAAAPVADVVRAA